jgi:hypothetical protein
MKTHSRLGLVIAVACLTGIAAVSIAHAQSTPQLVSNHPPVDPGDRTDSGTANRNVTDSGRYERMLQANVTFRQQRMQRECGSIDDPSLHEQCLASFR